MKQKKSHKYVYKLHSRQIKKAKYNLTLPLEVAMKEQPETIIALGDSQIMRFIDTLNNNTDSDARAKEIKREIKELRKTKQTNTTRRKMKEFYTELYNTQFCADYLCVVMDTNNDYDLLNKGFSVNGIKYRRLLGTNGGIKTATIVYVNEALYPALKAKIDNGRNKNVALVPAKLEAYQALVCSGSVPIAQPRIIVVNDCITHFKDDVIVLDDSDGKEPQMLFVDGYDIEHNDSDGYGLMTPEYSRKVNQELNGCDAEISGFVCRYAWTKGMVFTFDFVDFAEKIAGKYEIIDAWGQVRDVRNADVILTTSMLKMWSSYDSFESYQDNCVANGYEFSATKTTPDELEHIHALNYQFLQSYDLTDDELKELCRPTIEGFKDILGLDFKKSLLFLCGMGLSQANVISGIDEDDFDFVSRSLMVDPELINDPFIRKRIMALLKKQIDDAKKGVIKIEANYAMIGGDPYALCQSMFGLEITGLLQSGELYHNSLETVSVKRTVSEF